MNTMNMMNITAFSKGEQVQEPPCQHSPLRVFQSMFAAPQVDDDDGDDGDDDDDDDNKAVSVFRFKITYINRCEKKSHK